MANACPQQADPDIQPNPFFRFNEGGKIHIHKPPTHVANFNEKLEADIEGS